MEQLQARSAPMRDAGDDARLAKLSATLKGLRDEAIKARTESGIEAIWTEDQEYFDGIDDANRGEKQLKPSTSDGRVTRERKGKKGTRSNVFLNITRRYVESAAAYVSDKLFRSDVSNYGMRPTPKPDLVKQSKDPSPAVDASGQPVQMPVLDEQGQPEMAPHMVNGQPMIDQATGQPVMLPATKQATKGDIAKQILAQAKEAAEKAKVQIDDWLNECGINGQSRQMVLDSARIGTGVLKGPFPEMVKHSAVLEGENGVELVIEEKLVPKSRRISVWNLYPDPSCGQDIHRGKFIFEDDEINSRLLGELKNDPSYIAEAIDRVLEEGPKHAVTGTSKRKRTWNKGQNELFQIWYYHGYLSADDLEACGYGFDDEQQPEVEAGEEGELGLIDLEQEAAVQAGPGGDIQYREEMPKPDRKAQYPCIVVMVNDVVIKATVSPFDSGRFPYHVMRWQYRDDHWAGIGVARQMRTSQDGVNAGVRMLHDNAGVAGAPILIIDRTKIVPADGVWTVGPHKVYYTSEDFEGGNIRDAFTWIITPSLQVEMMNIIQFWMRSAEEETGLPMILQGQTSQAQTLGEAQLLNNNGSAMLRRVTNLYDDDVTKPHIGAYYEWLLIHGEDDSMKGDFTIDAIGSSVLIERDAHSQILMQMLGLSTNPAFGADPELVYKEFLLSQRFDAEKLMLSPEKKAELAKRGPPEHPSVTAAKIRADLMLKLEQMDDKDQADHVLAQARLELQRQGFEAGEAAKDRELALMLDEGRREIERAKLNGASAQTIQKLKVSLAEKTMALNLQRDMAVAGHRADIYKHKNPQVAKPGMEPFGKAEPGKAFEQ